MDILAIAAAKASAKRTYLPKDSFILDAATVAGVDGTVVNGVVDQSGNGNDFTTVLASTRPVLKIEGGRKHLLFGGSAYLYSMFQEPWPQPNTLIAVVRRAATAVSALEVLVGSAGAGRQHIRLDTSGTPQMQAGTASPTGGAPLNDGQWHILVATFGPTGSALYDNGLLVASSTSASPSGTEQMTGAAVGASVTDQGVVTTITSGLSVREYRGMKGVSLSPGRVQQVTAELAAKHGITVGRADVPATFLQTTSANGQAIRVWAPAPALRGASVPLVIWCHPHTANEQINPGYFAYPLVAALVNAGYAVAASNMHGDSWGNTNARDDIKSLYDYANTQFSVSKTALVGGSMGALAASLASVDGLIPNVKGVVTEDGVLSLLSMYAQGTYTTSIDTAYGITRGTLSGATTAGATSLPTTASFPTVGTKLLVGNGTGSVETVTTTGASNGASVAVTAMANAHASGQQVSDYSEKTAGRDPVLKSAASFTGIRWLLIASAADTAVPKTTNADAFATLAAASVEMTTVTHAGAHLATTGVRPRAVLDFLARCFA